jgi:YD repeat-containing protein
LIAFFALAENKSDAQQIDLYKLLNSNIGSPPTTAALGDLSKSKVSYFQGRPEISIPLYTIEENGFTLPISLSYNASGFKLTDMASWVGLGWSLNAGGAITRKVRGLQDEINGNGWLSDGLPIFNALISDGGACNGCPDGNSPASYYLTNIAGNNYDGLADIYSFNFGNYSGNFLFDGVDSSVILQTPDNPLLKIVSHRNSTPLDDGHFRHFNSFEITSGDGAIYKFGFNAVEATFFEDYSLYMNSTYQYCHDNNLWESFGGNVPAGHLQPPYLPYYNSWYLKEIILPNSVDTIHFTYESDSISYIPYWQDTYLYDYPRTSLTDSLYYSKIIKNYTDYGVITKRLTSISWKYGSIILGVSTQRRKDMGTFWGNSITNSYALSTVSIRNATNQIIRNISLSSSYFLDSNWYINLPHQGDCYYFRLKLDSLSIDNQKYSFTYNPKQLPPRFLPLYDFWGYFKHDSLFESPYGNDLHRLAKGRIYAYPTDTVNQFYKGIYSIYPRSHFNGIEYALPGKDKFPDLNDTKACILSQIKFPTGGTESFEYELNSFIFDGQERQAGGLRIKSIILSDGMNSNNDIIKEYDYHSSGKVSSIPEVAKFNIKLAALDNLPIWNYPDPEFLKWKYTTIQSSASYSDLSINGQNSVGYTQVTETCKSNSNQNVNGSTTYFFSFPDPLNDTCIYVSACLPSSPNGCRKAVKLCAISPGLIWNPNNPCYLASQYWPYKVVDNVPFLNNPEKAFSRGLLLKKSEYNNTNQCVKNTKYTYCYSTLQDFRDVKAEFYSKIEGVWEIFGVNPNTQNWETIFTAPYYYMDIRYGLEDNYFGSVTLNKIEEEYLDLNPTLYSETNNLYNDYNQLICSSSKNSAGDTIIKRFKYPRDYYPYNNSGDPYATAISLLRNKNMVDKPIEEIESTKSSGTEKTYAGVLRLLKTNQIGNLSQIYQEKLKRLETNSPINPFSMSIINNTNQFEFDPHYKDYINYDEYNFTGDLTLHQVHKTDDLNTSYYWGYKNAYQVVTAQDVSYDILEAAITSVQANLENLLNSVGDMTTQNQKNDWHQFNYLLRRVSSLEHALVTTYTYKPLVGITSMTDPAGLATYYEYDAFGRLLYVKDNYYNIVKKYDYHYKGE